MKHEKCLFCQIENDNDLASIVYKDEYCLAFMDWRQFHPGHTLVIPRMHFKDIRDLDSGTGSALMEVLSKITRAVSDCFPNEGISVWHSIGPAAYQEVPHLHIHVHPRHFHDKILWLYPNGTPPDTEKSILDQRADVIRAYLNT